MELNKIELLINKHFLFWKSKNGNYNPMDFLSYMNKLDLGVTLSYDKFNQSWYIMQ